MSPRSGIRAAAALLSLAGATAAHAGQRHEGPRIGDGAERAAAALRLERLHELRFGAGGIPPLGAPAAARLRGLGFTGDGAMVCFVVDAAFVTVTVADGAIAVRRPTWDRATFGSFAGEPRLELGRRPARAGEAEAAPIPFADVEVRDAWLSPSGALGLVQLPQREVAIVDVAAAETLGRCKGWFAPVAWDRSEGRIAVLGALDAADRPGHHPPCTLHVIETTGRRVQSIPGWRPAPVRAVGAFAPDGGALFWADDQLHRTLVPDGRTLQNVTADVAWLCAPPAAPSLLLSHDRRTLTVWVGSRLQAVKSLLVTEPGAPAEAIVASTSAPAQGLVAFATTERLLVYRLVP